MLKSLWPWAAIVLLLAASLGFFWMLGHGLRFTRQTEAFPAPPAAATAQAVKSAPKPDDALRKPSLSP